MSDRAELTERLYELRATHVFENTSPSDLDGSWACSCGASGKTGMTPASAYWQEHRMEAALAELLALEREAIALVFASMPADDMSPSYVAHKIRESSPDHSAVIGEIERRGAEPYHSLLREAIQYMPCSMAGEHYYAYKEWLEKRRALLDQRGEEG